MRGLLEQSGDDLLAWLGERGEPPLRARQVRRWIVAGRAESFEQMSDLPLPLRRDLAAAFVALETQIARHLESVDGTHKLLLRLHDGQMVECVLIQENDRRTACISTQVGCGMGCVFCASGLNGVSRNLSAGEILEQLIRLRNLLPADDRLTNIVVMGMGEPLANLDALVAALDVATHKDGLGIGARHVTVSTVGLPQKMRRLADLGRQFHLAVSLHAPNDELRTRIVPTNDKTGIDDILAAADYFFEKNGRRVTFEYVLLGDINDGPQHASELSRLLLGRCAHINLIPFNDVPGLPYRRPTDAAVQTFVRRLKQDGLSVKVRKRKGSEIDAACGQLRRSSAARTDKHGGTQRGVGWHALRYSEGRADSEARPSEYLRACHPYLDRAGGTPHGGGGLIAGRFGVAAIGQTSAQLSLRDPDVRLMIAVRDDVPGAFEQLVEAYQHRLINVMQHLIGRSGDAEDLAQEVFLRVYRRASGTGPVASFPPGCSPSRTTWGSTGCAAGSASRSYRYLPRTPARWARGRPNNWSPRGTSRPRSACSRWSWPRWSAGPWTRSTNASAWPWSSTSSRTSIMPKLPKSWVCPARR